MSNEAKTEYDKLFIGGKWTQPSTSQVIEVHCPATGEYVGPDGNRYTQADLAHPENKTWESMLIPPGQ